MRFAWSLTLLTVGCGLISSDITKVTYNLPTKRYNFETQSWMLPSGSFPQIDCGAGQPIVTCCEAPADCMTTMLACQGGVCTFSKVINVPQRMNLAMEVPELSALGSQSLVDAFISRISYAVTNNLNVDMPPVTLYVAPDGVMDPAAPGSGAKRFGTVPMTAAMSMKSGDVMLESDAQQTFAGYARNFATPFTFIATTTVVVPSGTPVPSGNVDIAINGAFSAQAAF